MQDPAAAAAAVDAAAAAAGGDGVDAAGTGTGKQGKQGVAVIVLGMAGSGKTSFMQRLNAHLHQHKRPCYVINLDPAVENL